MAAYGPGNPLIERDLDAELAALMNVEPSAEFLARVRTRVAQEPQPSAWPLSWTSWTSWTTATAFMCAVAVMTVVTVVTMSRIAQPASQGEPFANAAFSADTAVVERPTREMRAAMQSNADLTATIRAHVEQGNYQAIVRAAASYSINFAYIGAFWADKKVDGAIGISTVGRQAASDLAAAAVARDDAAIERALAVLTGTCSACHKRYRAQLPDQTYAIRL